MIALIITYVYEEGRRFDMDYYLNGHIPLVRKHVGEEVFSLMKGIKVLQGLKGATPDAPPAFIAQTEILFESLEDLAKYTKAAKDRPSDLEKYSDHPAIMTISQVVKN